MTEQIPPLLRVVGGTASAEELAAVITVLLARSGSPASAAPVALPSLWAAPILRSPQQAGPGAWRASGLPH